MLLRRFALSRVGMGAVGFVTCGVAYERGCGVACDRGSSAPDAESTFETWARTLDRPVDSRLSRDELQQFYKARGDKFSLFEREVDARRKNVAVWRWFESAHHTKAADSRSLAAGTARISMLVELDECAGDGRWGIAPGAISSALISDLLGWTSLAEAVAQGADITQLLHEPRMSSISRKYKRALVAGQTYLCNCNVQTVERCDSDSPPSWTFTLHAEIVDAQGGVCEAANAVCVSDNSGRVEVRRPHRTYTLYTPADPNGVYAKARDYKA